MFRADGTASTPHVSARKRILDPDEPPMRQFAVHGSWRKFILPIFFAAAGTVLSSGWLSSVAASSLRRTAEVIAIEQARPSVVNIHGRKTISTESPESGTDGIQQVNGMG